VAGLRESGQKIDPHVTRFRWTISPTEV
jgi:hypothetical protein